MEVFVDLVLNILELFVAFLQKFLLFGQYLYLLLCTLICFSIFISVLLILEHARHIARNQRLHRKWQILLNIVVCGPDHPEIIISRESYRLKLLSQVISRSIELFLVDFPFD